MSLAQVLRSTHPAAVLHTRRARQRARAFVAIEYARGPSARPDAPTHALLTRCLVWSDRRRVHRQGVHYDHPDLHPHDPTASAAMRRRPGYRHVGSARHLGIPGLARTVGTRAAGTLLGTHDRACRPVGVTCWRLIQVAGSDQQPSPDAPGDRVRVSRACERARVHLLARRLGESRVCACTCTVGNRRLCPGQGRARARPRSVLDDVTTPGCARSASPVRSMTPDLPGR